MSVIVRVPTILRTYTGGARDVRVAVEGVGAQTVAGVLNALESGHPGILARVVDEEGRLRRFVNLYVDDEDVRGCGGLAAPVPPGSELVIVPAVAGG
ncbi:MoaD/ThiS family protein [Streptomyces sp. NPDC060028]|uniref:MoaD/ThiS family protein n=1 Tax=Streptomyces sp. NPDC060028 TaxID=3347041 RepID=UPI0036CB7F4B